MSGVAAARSLVHVFSLFLSRVPNGSLRSVLPAAAVMGWVWVQGAACGEWWIVCWLLCLPVGVLCCCCLCLFPSLSVLCLLFMSTVAVSTLN